MNHETGSRLSAPLQERRFPHGIEQGELWMGLIVLSQNRVVIGCALIANVNDYSFDLFPRILRDCIGTVKISKKYVRLLRRSSVVDWFVSVKVTR